MSEGKIGAEKDAEFEQKIKTQARCRLIAFAVAVAVAVAATIAVWPVISNHYASETTR